MGRGSAPTRLVRMGGHARRSVRIFAVTFGAGLRFGQREGKSVQLRTLIIQDSARKRKVGKKKTWYDGKVTKIDKDENEYSVYFESDKETTVLNFSDTSAKDYMKEGHGWRIVQK